MCVEDEVQKDEEDLKEREKIEERKMVEATLFAAGKPLSVEEISDSTGLNKRKTASALRRLVKYYAREDSAIEVSPAGLKYSMHLKPEYSQSARKVAPGEIPEKVLKTAAIIGYYQPISQADLVKMRGASAYEHVSILKDFGLITTRKKGPTKIIKITPRFSEYFAIGSKDPGDVKTFLAHQLGLKVKRKKGRKKGRRRKKKEKPTTEPEA